MKEDNSTAGAVSAGTGSGGVSQPRWLSEGKKRVAAADNTGPGIRVGSDIHLLEMAISDYEKTCTAHDELVEALKAIAGFGQINLSAEWESGLRDIIRSCVDAARAALAKATAPVDEVEEQGLAVTSEGTP